MKTPPRSGPISAFRHLLTSEAGSGIVLMTAAAAALIVANSPTSEVYFRTFQLHIAGLSVLEWINDALMAVFFLGHDNVAQDLLGIANIP
jgi:NhaA family Na+:H+ antiporter